MAAMSHTERALREEYERLRSAGLEHHEAMEAIRCAMSKAVQQAAAIITEELRNGTLKDMQDDK